MSGPRHTEREHWIPLSAVAECFEVEVAWIEEVYAYGLLGPGRDGDGTVLIAARMLERVAVIRRLTVQQGLNLPGIEMVLYEMRL